MRSQASASPGRSSTLQPCRQCRIADLDRAEGHHREAEGDQAVDVVHRKVDDGHLQVRILRHQLDREPRRVGEERDPDDVDEGRQRAPDLRRQLAVEELDVDVRVPAHAHRRADEADDDQQVAGDLLGPRRRVAEHVAGEELVEDVERQQPEEGEREPVLPAVARQVDRPRRWRGSAPRRRGPGPSVLGSAMVVPPGLREVQSRRERLAPAADPAAGPYLIATIRS